MGTFDLVVALAVVWCGSTATAATRPASTATNTATTAVTKAATTIPPTTSWTTTPKPVICPYSVCTCTGAFVNCSGKGLYRIPYLESQYTPGEFTKVDFSGNRISSIRNNQLPVNITELNLGDNPILSITDNAFIESRDTLNKLRFSNPRFTQLPTALQGLDELEALEVSGVNITDWNLDVIQHLGVSIQSVNFSDTSMTQWPDFIKYFPFLHELDLSYNPIKRIPSNALVEWRKQLIRLRLAHTNITTVSFAIQLKSLEYLDISGNDLRNHVQLSYDLIPLSRTLKELDLSLNLLTISPRLVDFSELTSLNLANTALRVSDVAAFPVSLQSLNLDNNQFVELPENVKDLKALKTLSISNNKIKVLSGEQFPHSSSPLVNLDVSGNPIHSVTRHAFDALSRLQKLDMSCTDITSLPLALSQLRALKELCMESNDDLLCLCKERSLSSWYVRRMRDGMTVTGECGSESITEFIERFTAYCD